MGWFTVDLPPGVAQDVAGGKSNEHQDNHREQHPAAHMGAEAWLARMSSGRAVIVFGRRACRERPAGAGCSYGCE
jgi:hypothetical protein